MSSRRWVRTLDAISDGIIRGLKTAEGAHPLLLGMLTMIAAIFLPLLVLLLLWLVYPYRH